MRRLTLIRGMLALALLAPTSPALAQSMQAGTVTMIRTGWNSDSFAVVTAEPIANPARCPTPDGYISEKTLPGYSTYYAAALTAYLARRRVVITVHNTECFGSRPKLIGINLTLD
jgi:hypothetical protein